MPSIEMFKSKKSIHMKTTQEQLLIKKEDFDIITTHIKTGLAQRSFDRKNVAELEAELKKAKLVSSENFPATVVGLNSTVIIKDVETNRVLSFTIVTPDRANFRQNKISVLAPMGTALLGFRKGQLVSWKVPSGQKKFIIMEVASIHMLQ
jgi:regulator of nucleoside diphosphate kinase